MITDKDRAFYNGFIAHVRSYHEHDIYHVPIFNIEETEILKTLGQREERIRSESAEQARKEAAERICKRCLKDTPCKNNCCTVSTILGDSVVKENLITGHIPGTGKKLAVAVKALEDIASRRGESFMIASCALEEIKE